MRIRHRAWLALVATAFVLVSSRGNATPPASSPPDIEGAIRRACGAGEMNVAGPWASASDRYWAGVVWRTGSPQACLVLLRATPVALRVDAYGRIPAGYSSRYDDFFAPQLRAEPLLLDGHAPAPITDATQMGAGGGGGDRTMVWLARSGHWSPAFDAVLNSASDINTAVSSPCPNVQPLAVETRSGHVELRTRSCFDGRFFRIRMRFDGTRFVE